jgi:hypothetical protein
MAEPVLRLVLPEMEDDRDQAPPRGATSKQPAGEVAPADGATNGATTTATNSATTGATSTATNTAAAATNGTGGGATNPAAATAADPAPEAAGDPAAVPELEPVGRPMTAGEKAARLARHWAASAREEAMRPGELLHAAYHGRAESIAQIHVYAKSRAWVPEDYEGWAVPFFGAVYSHTIAKGGAALGGSIAWVTARALRLTVFMLIAGVLTVLIIAFS